MANKIEEDETAVAILVQLPDHVLSYISKNRDDKRAIRAGVSQKSVNLDGYYELQDQPTRKAKATKAARLIYNYYNSA